MIGYWSNKRLNDRQRYNAISTRTRTRALCLTGRNLANSLRVRARL